MRILLLAILGLMALNEACAGVYRCVGEDGEITYSNVSCPDKSDRTHMRIDRAATRTREPAFNEGINTSSTESGVILMIHEGSWKVHGDHWSVAEPYAKNRCIRTHPNDYSLQAACVRNAKRGFEEFLGSNYGMPPGLAKEVKIQCINRHPEDFSLQAACMRNESRGYREMR